MVKHWTLLKMAMKLPWVNLGKADLLYMPGMELIGRKPFHFGFPNRRGLGVQWYFCRRISWRSVLLCSTTIVVPYKSLPGKKTRAFGKLCRSLPGRKKGTRLEGFMLSVVGKVPWEFPKLWWGLGIMASNAMTMTELDGSSVSMWITTTSQWPRFRMCAYRTRLQF